MNPTLPLNENLESIRKALAGTTAGKWHTDDANPKLLNYEFREMVYTCDKMGITDFPAVCDSIANATWIAASKEIVEYLLKVVELYKEATIEAMVNYHEKRDDKFLEEIRKVQPTVIIPRREHSRRLLEAWIQKRLEGTKP